MALHSLLEGTEEEVEWECVEVEVWTAVGQQEQVDLEDSAEAGEVTVEDSEDVEEWIGEVSVGLAVVDHRWIEWETEVEEEWDHQVARWI